MQSLLENWFFLLVALGCLAMHMFGHGHGSGHRHEGPGQDDEPAQRQGADPVGREGH